MCGHGVSTCESSVSNVEHEPLLGGLLLLFAHVDHRCSCGGFFGVFSILQFAGLVCFYGLLLLFLLCEKTTESGHQNVHLAYYSFSTGEFGHVPFFSSGEELVSIFSSFPSSAKTREALLERLKRGNMETTQNAELLPYL